MGNAKVLLGLFGIGSGLKLIIFGPLLAYLGLVPENVNVFYLGSIVLLIGIGLFCQATLLDSREPARPQQTS